MLRMVFGTVFLCCCFNNRNLLQLLSLKLLPFCFRVI